MSLYNVVKTSPEGLKKVVAHGLDLKSAEALTASQNRRVRTTFNCFGYRDNFAEYDFVIQK